MEETVQTIPTKQRLADAIREADPSQTDLINAALAGQFDDFESDSPMPIIDLVQALRAANLSELAKRALEGEFDGTQEEAEAWYQREGAALLQEFTMIGGEA